jgi:hypothetical protein
VDHCRTCCAGNTAAERKRDDLVAADIDAAGFANAFSAMEQARPYCDRIGNQMNVTKKISRQREMVTATRRRSPAANGWNPISPFAPWVTLSQLSAIS